MVIASELIKQVVKGGSETHAAMLELVESGPEVVPDIIQAIKHYDLPRTWDLQYTVLLIRDPAILPLMADLLRSNEDHLVLLSARWLGMSSDAGALSTLCDFLVNPAHRLTHRTWVAEALGNLGNGSAIPDLLDTAKSEWPLDEFDVLETGLVVACAVALAKLGNQELSPAVIEFASWAQDEEMIETFVETALEYILAPGLRPLLQRYLERDAVSQQQAIDVFFYLGDKDSIDRLVAFIDQQEPPESIEYALQRIADLTGESFDWRTPPEKVVGWWRENSSQYNNDGVCYRLGKPIWFPNIIELLNDSSEKCAVLIEELRVRTGRHFGEYPYFLTSREWRTEDAAKAYEKALVWWQENEDRFRPGRLYKSGHQQDLERTVSS